MAVLTPGTCLDGRYQIESLLASGGIGTIDHIRRLKDKGIWGVIVGRALYEGTVTLAEALRVAAE